MFAATQSVISAHATKIKCCAAHREIADDHTPHDTVCFAYVLRFKNTVRERDNSPEPSTRRNRPESIEAPFGATIERAQLNQMQSPGNSIIGEPSPSVRESNGSDGAVLLDIQQGICFSLNPVGAKIWAFIKERKSTDDIIASLVKDFDVPEEQIRSDVADFAALLKQNGLLLTGKPSAKRSSFLRTVIDRLVSAGLLLRE